MQRTIRERFTGFTILTIAHRLQTIVDSDLIVVLRDGAVAESASPAVLLADTKSLFSGMVDEMGVAAAAQLRAVAKAAAGPTSGAVEAGVELSAMLFRGDGNTVFVVRLHGPEPCPIASPPVRHPAASASGLRDGTRCDHSNNDCINVYFLR